MDDESEPGTSTANQTVKDKQKSLVWKFFVKLSSDSARCVKCKKVFKTSAGNTSGLARHLTQHPLLNQQFVKDQSNLKKVKSTTSNTATVTQTKISACFAQRWDSDSPKAKVITNKIAHWMAKSFHPYSLVEEEGFKGLMKEVAPLYSLPSRTTFSRTIIPNLYKNTRNSVLANLEDDLKSAKSLSFTTDLWSSSSNRSFLSLTLHYQDSGFKIKRYSLGAEYFSEDHTASAIRNKTQEMLESWRLNEIHLPKYIITDNAANMVSAFGAGDSVFRHHRCFAHTLQLCISDIKQENKSLSGLLGKARSIVGHYKHSNKASERLRSFQQMMKLPEHGLVQDVDTRWNSEYLMLERLVEQKSAISAELAASPSGPSSLTSDEWLMAEGYIKILQPLHHATKAVGEDVLPTKSLEIPILHGIEKYLNSVISAKDKGVMLARSLLKSIKTRFPLYKQDYCRILCMVVDPRFKHALLDKHDHEKVFTLLKSEIDKHRDELPSESQPVSMPSTSCSDILFSDIDNLQTIQTNREEEVKSQIEKYLQAKTIARTTNPCDFWKENQLQFSYLIPVVREYLPIPATSIASERLFSSAGNVVTKKRQKLLTKHISELVFLHENL